MVLWHYLEFLVGVNPRTNAEQEVFIPTIFKSRLSSRISDISVSSAKLSKFLCFPCLEVLFAIFPVECSPCFLPVYK